jgi:hypothetical protein
MLELFSVKLLSTINIYNINQLSGIKWGYEELSWCFAIPISPLCL